MVCREIRKRGYSLHADYDKICTLIDIDIAYDTLRDQPLAFKAFGDIAHKPIDEPHYIVMRNYLENHRKQSPKIYITATPLDFNLSYLEIPAVSSFEISMHPQEVDSLSNY